MQKRFDEWNDRKKKLHQDVQRPYFHEREIWFCSLGVNVGFEQDGASGTFMRPILVFKRFNKQVFWGIPLTRTSKRGEHYFPFIMKGGSSTAILSQLRLIDAYRLSYKVGTMTVSDFSKLNKKLRALLP